MTASSEERRRTKADSVVPALGHAIVAKAEDAAELRLGEEIDHETSVSNAEVAILLTKAKYEAEDRAVPEVLAFYIPGCSTQIRPFLTMAKTNGRG
jgi:hypothetical protein